MIVVCTPKPKAEKQDAPEQTLSTKPREIKVIKAGTHKAVPTPAPKLTRKTDSEIRRDWVKAKNESKRNVYRTAMAFFFDVPDACMQVHTQGAK